MGPWTAWRHISNSYNMDARALAYLLHEGAKRPRAINELSALASMLCFPRYRTK